MRAFRPAFCGILLMVMALGAGCVGGGTSSGGVVPSVQGDVTQCTEAFTYAPAAYVIHIASGDAVILDPVSNDFQLFCDTTSATKGLQNALTQGAIPEGDWKIYRVYGQWSDIATEAEPGVFLLNRPAPLVDWVN